MVHRGCVDSEVYERVVECIFLHFARVKKASMRTQHKSTYQRVEVEQHVSLPRRLCLRPRATFDVNALAEEQQRLICLALLVLRNHVDARPRRLGRAEAEAEVRRAIVDAERGLLVAVRVVGGGDVDSRQGLYGQV